MRRTKIENTIVKPFFVLTSALTWFLVTQYVSGYMGWSLEAVKLSYYVAFFGGAFSFIVARSRGRLRRIIYDFSYAGYVSLLIVAVPLLALYFLMVEVLMMPIPVSGDVVNISLSKPFTLIAAWLFSFTLYKTLDTLYGTIVGFGEEEQLTLDAGKGMRKEVDKTLLQLDVQQRKLAAKVSEMENHCKELFGKCTAAQARREREKAAVYANAYLEAKRATALLLNVQLSLERVVSRLTTIREVTEIPSAVLPALDTLHALKGSLSGVFPEFSYELEKIMEDAGLLQLQSMDAGGLTAPTPGEEAQNILMAADTLLKERAKNR